MARIDWALACALAFFDRENRLCVVGITRRLPVPHLPLAVTQLMLVARLVDLATIDDVEIAVAVTAPSGRSLRPSDGDGMVIEMAGEYVLITLRDIPLIEEGLHGFQISLGGQPPTSIEIPVVTVNSPMHAGVH
jgi:hypothetical protein